MEFNPRKAIIVGFTCLMLTGCAANQSQVNCSHTMQTTESIRSVSEALTTSPYLQMQQPDGRTLLLEFPEIQAFSFDGASLSQELQAALTDVAEASIQNTNLNIEVIGHTDNIGNTDYNQVLSENRARQVADFLNQQGVQMSRIQVTGMGQDEPIADNRTAEGRAANRRVELIISE